MGGKQKNSKFRIEFKGGLKVLGTKKRVLASTRINSGVRNRESVPYGLVKRLSLLRLHGVDAGSGGGGNPRRLQGAPTAARKINQLSGKLVSSEFLHILD